MRPLWLLAALALAAARPAGGFDRTNLDPTADPCADFDRFANGGWKDRTEIPPQYPAYGSFQELNEQAQQQLRTLLDAAALDRKAPRASVRRKLGDFWAAAMEEKQVEQAGIKPLRSELTRIAAIHDRASLEQEIARLQGLGANVAFRFGAAPDLRDSRMAIASASQGGLGLTDRDDYLRTDERSQQTREAYEKHVAAMLALLGDSPERAAAGAKTVLSLETRLAEASKPRVALRDPVANYHKLDLAALAELTPELSWPRYFATQGVPDVSAVNVGQPDFFRALDHLLTDIPLEDWKTYLRWQLVNDLAGTLSTPFVEEDFAFYGKTLTGASENLPRWQRMVKATSGAMGEALGQLYVERRFSPEAKAQVLAMLHRIEAALRQRIQTLDWMSEDTRAAALAKLDAITEKIGYPDQWRDYTALEISRKSLAENVMAASRFEHQRNLAKIGKPVDRSEWLLPAFAVNAYYNPTQNEIVFPAGILQPPFFDPAGDDALNYGGIGAVIGHEITHGFDDQGRKFGPDGNLDDWWSAQDSERFQQRADCVERQFSAVEIEDGLHLDGKLVLGEAIADLGGLDLAREALPASPAAEENAATDTASFTPAQRFFLGWAQVWRARERPEYRRLRARNDPHPPPGWRINGPLANLPGFAEAFSCAPDANLVRTKSCRVW